MAQRSLVRWLKFAIAALAFLVACSDEKAPRRGQIIVAMQTDMDIPKDLDKLRVVILVNGAVAHDRLYDIGPDIEKGENLLPATLAIGAEKAREERDLVEVKVLAQQGRDSITLGRLVTTIPKNRIATLYMPVQWLCKDQLEANSELPNTYDSTC